MSVVNYDIENIDIHTVLITWKSLGKGDTGKPIGKEFAQYADRSVQVFGTFATETVTYQGSNDTVNAAGSEVWSTLNDVGNTALTFTTARAEQIQENMYQERPSVSGTGAGTTVNVAVLCRRVRP